MAIDTASDEPRFLLATLPPTELQRRLALAAAAVLLVTFALAAPFAAAPLPRFDAFIPMLEVTIFVTDLITAVLLFAQYSIFPSRALLALACGYLFTALIVIPHLLTYPGVFTPTGLLGAGLQSTGWLYFFWHIGFAAALLLYACLKADRPSARNSTPSAIEWSIATVLSLVCALGWLATGGEWLLPRIFLDVTRATPLAFYIFAANISLAALALVLLWIRRRSVLDLWLMVVICALISELALVGVIGSSRFALGFYAGRIFSLLTSTVVLVVLLVETTRLYARLHKSLEESEEQTALVAASTNTGLWQFLAEDEPIWATRHCRSILGLPEDAPLSLQALSGSIHPDDRRAFVRITREAASTGQPIDREFRVMSPAGEIRWIAVKGYPRRHEDDSTYYINGVLSDVTAVKAAESEAELQRREIARLMRQSVLGELSGAIAHELNQPLTAILSNAEAAHDLLGQKKVDLQRIREIVADIIEEDARASDVMSRIRRLLRKGESKPEIVDLNQLVSSTLPLLHSELVTRNIHMETALAEGLPTISGDPVELQQVLLNALMNAIEAMSAKPAGQRVLKVMTRADGSQVQAVIVDSGDGISPEHQARIFQPFFTTKAQGLGLGLSICSTIMKAHGGSLGIENNTGGGATVTVTLPIRDSVGVPA